MITPTMRVLYVLNALGGGASLGIYEFLRARKDSRLTAYAAVPPGNESLYQSIQPLFADTEMLSLSWWNIRKELGPLRRTAIKIGQLRHGSVLVSNVNALKACIERWHIDIVHTGTAMTLAGALAARDLTVPHVWHIKETIGSGNRVHFPMPDDELVAYMENLSSEIIVMSEYIGAIFREHGCTKLTVIPDGLDLAHYRGKSRKLRGQLSVADDEILIGMVASLVSTWKRHEVFIKMAALIKRRYPNARFLLIGDKPSPNARWPNNTTLNYYEHLKQIAQSLNLGNRLIIADPSPDPPDIMRSLDILVHTCDIEPFGRIAIEAMAAGKAVVGPQTGGIAETVVDGTTGLLVPPNDAEAFAGAVERLIDDPDLRRRLGEAGRARVAAHYNVQSMLDRLEAVYSRVTREHITG